MRVQARYVAPLLVLAIVGCGVEGAPDVGDSTVTTQGEDRDPVTSTTLRAIPETTMENAPSPVEAAIADLANLLDVPPDAVAVVSSKEVTWPDGSLGCPQEGMSYTQAIVNGTQILLDSNGRLFDYRAGADGQFVLCPSDEKDGGYDFVPPPGLDD